MLLILRPNYLILRLLKIENELLTLIKTLKIQMETVYYFQKAFTFKKT